MITLGLPAEPVVGRNQRMNKDGREFKYLSYYK